MRPLQIVLLLCLGPAAAWLLWEANTPHKAAIAQAESVERPEAIDFIKDPVTNAFADLIPGNSTTRIDFRKDAAPEPHHPQPELSTEVRLTLAKLEFERNTEEFNRLKAEEEQTRKD